MLVSRYIWIRICQEGDSKSIQTISIGQIYSSHNFFPFWLSKERSKGLRKHGLNYFYRDQSSTFRLKYVGNLSLNILLLYSSAIQSNKPSIFPWEGWGMCRGIVSIIKPSVQSGSFKRKIFQNLWSSLSLLSSCHCGLTYQTGSRWCSVMFSFIHICKMCPTYQTSTLSHILLKARSIWLHGVMWNKHCGVPATHAISALFLCIAVGGLVQPSMMYQWAFSGVLRGG